MSSIAPRGYWNRYRCAWNAGLLRANCELLWCLFFLLLLSSDDVEVMELSLSLSSLALDVDELELDGLYRLLLYLRFLFCLSFIFLLIFAIFSPLLDFFSFLLPTLSSDSGESELDPDDKERYFPVASPSIFTSTSGSASTLVGVGGFEVCMASCLPKVIAYTLSHHWIKH